MQHRAGAQGEKRRRQRAVVAGIAALLLIGVAACSAPVTSSTAAPSPTAAQLNEHASEGEAKYVTTGCAACHGDHGEGGIGPRSSGTQMRLADLQLLVRSGDMDGVRYDYDELSDQDVANIYLWLRTNPAGDPPPPERTSAHAVMYRMRSVAPRSNRRTCRKHETRNVMHGLSRLAKLLNEKHAIDSAIANERGDKVGRGPE